MVRNRPNVVFQPLRPTWFYFIHANKWFDLNILVLTIYLQFVLYTVVL